MQTITSPKNIFFIKIAILFAVFAILIYGMHFESSYIWIIPIYLVIGYFFGKLTCGTHLHKYGLWLTLGLFILLNFIHSMIDGILLVNLSALYRDIAVYSHELIRQPALYVIAWAMLAPFGNKYVRIVSSIAAVTGVWVIGMYVGSLGGNYFDNLARFDVYFAAMIFIFAGDIIHHLMDEYVKLKKV